jgi:hypothetical protein
MLLRMLGGRRNARADSPIPECGQERARPKDSRPRVARHPGWAALSLAALWAAHWGSAQALCERCEIELGLGATYHFWGTTGGVVLPLSVTWSENCYELGIFGFATHQNFFDADFHSELRLASPYWGVSASRRWRLFAYGPLEGYFGFGLAYRSESDVCSVTRWDFASQLGLRLQLPGGRSRVSLTMRHWSNAGVRLPNHGQDFVTLTWQLNR